MERHDKEIQKKARQGKEMKGMERIGNK